jgi:hypothetical protein
MLDINYKRWVFLQLLLMQILVVPYYEVLFKSICFFRLVNTHTHTHRNMFQIFKVIIIKRSINLVQGATTLSTMTQRIMTINKAPLCITTFSIMTAGIIVTLNKTCILQGVPTFLLLCWVSLFCVSFIECRGTYSGLATGNLHLTVGHIRLHKKKLKYTTESCFFYAP